MPCVSGHGEKKHGEWVNTEEHIEGNTERERGGRRKTDRQGERKREESDTLRYDRSNDQVIRAF